MTIKQLLKSVENSINSEHERAYFWIHESRYAVILSNIQSIVNNTRYAVNRSSKLRVLDVGCFPYHLGKAMEDMGMDVYGISSEHEP